ncbi:hypothetical protein [Algoriphagus sediminis]|uniref:Uncharacterized protein n=1 Tax=Algoriphagus sediminis TaxID=3057113 RepID=A0ABT7YB99_9BACT|nr:hypothetical protein [Algoriphagus sediminis]MDN3203792.1 hypothetical protein [Algoriphagus sediminis]
MKSDRRVKFRVGGEDWDFPLGTFVLLLVITLVLMVGGAWLGFRFGSGGL